MLAKAAAYMRKIKRMRDPSFSFGTSVLLQVSTLGVCRRYQLKRETTVSSIHGMVTHRNNQNLVAKLIHYDTPAITSALSLKFKHCLFSIHHHNIHVMEMSTTIAVFNRWTPIRLNDGIHTRAMYNYFRKNKTSTITTCNFSKNPTHFKCFLDVNNQESKWTKL